MNWRIVTSAWILLVTPGVGFAEVERPLVVDVTTFAAEPRTEAVQTFLMQNSPLKPGTYPLVSVANTDLNQSLRWWIPSPGAAACNDNPGPISDFLERGREAWNRLELDEGLKILEEAQRSFACQGELVQRQDLWDLIFLQGVIHHYLEDGLATGTFAEALSIDLNLKPSSGFPPEIQSAFQAAVAQTRQNPWMSLEVPEQLADSGLVVDGQPVPAGVGSINLQPGRHFIQAVGPEGQMRGEVFNLVQGDNRDLIQMTAILPARPQVVSAMIRAQLTEGRLDPLITRGLTRYARANHHSFILFVVPAPGTSLQMKILTFKPGVEGLVLGPPPDLPELSPLAGASTATLAPENPRQSGERNPDPSQRDGARLTTGAGLLYYDKTPFGVMTPGLLLPMGPLGLSVAGILAFGGEGAHINGARAGLQLNILQGQFRPFVGLGYQVVTGRIVETSDGTVLRLEGTPEVFTGADLAPASGARFGLRLGGGYTPGLALVGEEVEPPSRLLLSMELSGGWAF